ncbi:MAG: hypothetical protein Q4P66_00065, partial [Actinomycetaceae bacterium]|nr:hypothetical protein [Actinomycetaceae bacterium]
AHEHDLLLMGPDCGTAIINGVGLCFANDVTQGSIGIVGASGTGSQELSVQIDALGAGISQLIGVGGRDLSERIGGRMMLDGMAMLAEDPETEVIVLLSKQPHESVANTVLERAGQLGKPVVVCFIGADKPNNLPDNVTFVDNTFAAAATAVKSVCPQANPRPAVYELDYQKIKDGFSSTQTAIRGLFCGGTVCDEVFHVIKKADNNTFSNNAKDCEHKFTFGDTQKGNCLIDLGADEYTQGRPHPMIDPTIRNGEILAVAQDPAAAVLLLDFELGFGSHEDPVGAALETVIQAQEDAAQAGRQLTVVAYVLGTDNDVQGKKEQVSKLTEAGVIVVESAIDLASVALEIVKE